MFSNTRRETVKTARDEKADRKIRRVSESARDLNDLVQRNLSIVPDEIDHLIDEYSAKKKKTANGKH